MKNKKNFVAIVLLLVALGGTILYESGLQNVNAQSVEVTQVGRGTPRHPGAIGIHHVGRGPPRHPGSIERFL